MKTVGVSFEVDCSSFYEESILQLLFEDDAVNVPGLSILSGKGDFILRKREIVRLIIRLLDMTLLQSINEEWILLFKTVQVRPRIRNYLLLAVHFFHYLRKSIMV